MAQKKRKKEGRRKKSEEELKKSLEETGIIEDIREDLESYLKEPVEEAPHPREGEGPGIPAERKPTVAGAKGPGKGGPEAGKAGAVKAGVKAAKTEEKVPTAAKKAAKKAGAPARKGAVLVTGVSGYWGRRVADRLAEQDPSLRVIGIDSKPPSGVARLSAVRNWKYVRLDILSPLLSRLLRSEEVDRVCHLLFFPREEKDESYLKDIMAIGGQGGLFRFISQGRNGIIVESLEDGRRMQAFATMKVSALEDIAVYTEDEEIQLEEVFMRIHKYENGAEAISHKSDADDLKDYFSAVLPEYDRERVYASDIKKILNWYNFMLKKDLLKIIKPKPKPKPASKKEA